MTDESHEIRIDTPDGEVTAHVIGRLKRYHSWALQKVPVSFSG